jgi:hypothetical protein
MRAVRAHVDCARARAIEENTAADGALRSRVSQDETIADGRCDRTFEDQLDESGDARRERIVPEKDGARAGFSGRIMQANRRPLGRGRVRREQMEPGVDPIRRRTQRRSDVDPSRTSWVWMPTANLVKGMRTFDTAETRGSIVVSAR